MKTINKTELLETREVRSTKQYHEFTTLEGNRYKRDKLNNSAYAKSLENRMDKEGQLSPITVDRDLNIIAGQTRFDVCKRLGIAVKYIQLDISKTEGLIFMLEDGITTKKWTAIDAVAFWVARDYKPYCDLLDIIEKTGISISHIGKINDTIKTKTTIIVNSNKFIYGGLDAIKKDELMERCQLVQSVLASGKWSSPRRVINAFKWMMQVQGKAFTTHIFNSLAVGQIRQINKISTDMTFEKMAKLSKPYKGMKLDIPTSVGNA